MLLLHRKSAGPATSKAYRVTVYGRVCTRIEEFRNRGMLTDCERGVGRDPCECQRHSVLTGGGGETAAAEDFSIFEFPADSPKIVRGWFNSEDHDGRERGSWRSPVGEGRSVIYRKRQCVGRSERRVRCSLHGRGLQQCAYHGEQE